MKFKSIVKIIYFIMLQVSFGCMYWVSYGFLTYFKEVIYDFMVCSIFILGIAFPNFYISEKLISNKKLATFLQISILVLVANILFSKFGSPIIIVK